MEDLRIAMDDILPTVLDIDVHHYVRDQSVGLNYDENKRIDYRELKPGMSVDSGCAVFGSIMVDEVTEKSLSLTCGGETHIFSIGDEWKIGPCLVNDNPCVSSDEITLTISYYVRTP